MWRIVIWYPDKCVSIERDTKESAYAMAKGEWFGVCAIEVLGPDGFYDSID